MWIDDFNGADSAIVRFNTAGTLLKSTKVGGGPQGITAGPSGQLGFTNPTASPQDIGRIDYAGNVGHTTVPTGTDPFGIVFAHDGAYWTAEFGANALGRLTTDGAHTQPILFGAGMGPRRLTLGTGDTLWVGLETAQKIARITGVSAPVTMPPAGGGLGTSPATAAVVSNASETNSRFRVARKFGSVSVTRKRAPVGTTFEYTLDKPAAVRFDFTQPARGRKVNGKCVAQNKRNKRKRRCTRTLIRGSLTFSGHAGRNTVRFFGWLSRHKKLKPGRYTLVITATTPGVGSTSQKLTFTIVK